MVANNEAAKIRKMDNGARDDVQCCAKAAHNVTTMTASGTSTSTNGDSYHSTPSNIVNDAQLRTKSPRYSSHILDCLHNKREVTGDNLAATLGESIVSNCQRGKVRDRYTLSHQEQHRVALVTTDRQSGFDRALCQVPFKGAVLNLTSAFWFEQTASIIPNHLISVPHANVTIARTCTPFPIEFVMRSYMTGSTSTSIWKNYHDHGVRNYCGHVLPDGMVKNQKLAHNLLTPTTKEEAHDRPISLHDIVAEHWMTQDDLDVCAAAAQKVFALGQQVAAERGLILVDTKYEFGKCHETGQIRLIDEVHTPDSSRYWLSSTYEQRLAAGQEPDNIDKEFLRLWYAQQCDPYQDKVLPDAPVDLVAELSRRYILLYELIVGKEFDFEAIAASASGDEGIAEAIRSSIK
jgi:phosphoribosylaminoimidazole-succinocarboxamide synthase